MTSYLNRACDGDINLFEHSSMALAFRRKVPATWRHYRHQKQFDFLNVAKSSDSLFHVSESVFGARISALIKMVFHHQLLFVDNDGCREQCSSF